MGTTVAVPATPSPEESLVRQETEPEAKNNILSLPAEVTIDICGYITQPDKLRFAFTCKKLSGPAITALQDQDAQEDNDGLCWAISRGLAQKIHRILTSRPHLVNTHFKEQHLCIRNRYVVFAGESTTPLNLAIRFRQPASVGALLTRGADTNLFDKAPTGKRVGKWSPIHWAVATIKAGEGFDHVLYLLGLRGVDLNVSPQLPESYVARSLEDPYGTAYFRPEDLAPLFSQLNFMHPKPLATQDEVLRTSTTIFHNDLIALIKARMSKIESLLKAGADPNHVEKNTACTPIFHVARAVKNYKENFYVRNSNIWQGWDIQEQYNEIIIPSAMYYWDVLIKHGGDATIRCEGTTALHIVVQRLSEYQPLVYYLMDHGLGINVTDEQGRTPLFEIMGAVTTDFPALNKFIRKGAKVNHIDHKGWTALHVLVEARGSQEMLRRTIVTLIDHGADASIKNNDGLTALDVALMRHVPLWDETIDFLREAVELAIYRKNEVKFFGAKPGPSRMGDSHSGSQSSSKTAHDWDAQESGVQDSEAQASDEQNSEVQDLEMDKLKINESDDQESGF